MNSRKVTFKFDSDEILEEFVGWFLDGGGDQGFMDAVNMRTAKRVWIDNWNKTPGGFEIDIEERKDD
jgi:hypothetical protein